MPVSVVSGGQFGSEGKGKVACWLTREHDARAVVRVGGSNSGHTVVTGGERHIFRHLPTAALLPDVLCLLGAGSYIDPEIFLEEIRSIEDDRKRVFIDPAAAVITDGHKRRERESGLRDAVASTLSGTGASVQDRISRRGNFRRAADHKDLAPYVGPVKEILRELIQQGERIVVEGTQGYGLSLLHSEYYPYVTSRDTTAAGFVSEAGLSPRDVDEVVLVLRAFPIRVGGPSGPLPRETDWETVTRIAGSPESLQERTSVTRTVRRVARFSPKVVRKAIRVNRPSHLVLNHLDHVDHDVRTRGELTGKAIAFIQRVEDQLDRHIDYVGYGPETDAMINRSPARDSSPTDPHPSGDTATVSGPGVV